MTTPNVLKSLVTLEKSMVRINKETPFASLAKTTKEIKTNKPDVRQIHVQKEDGSLSMEDATFVQITNASEPAEEEPTSASSQAALVRRISEFFLTAHALHAQLNNN
jgi:hypothetical protein